MTQPATSTCAPWATTADLPEGSACADRPLIDTWLQIASDVLWALSGRQYSGVCEATFRPVTGCAPSRWPALRSVAGGWGFCCDEHRSLDLGVYPIVAVQEVKVDGAVLDAARYRVDDWRYLVRLPDADGRRRSWPGIQRLDRGDDQPGTWSLTIQYGSAPPAAGVQAAIALGCELAASADPGENECRLPERVTSITRQGVSAVVLDPMDFLTDGRTGIYEVDLFLTATNPGRLSRPPSVLTPASMRKRLVRTNTSPAIPPGP